MWCRRVAHANCTCSRAPKCWRRFLGDALLIDGVVRGGETDTPLGRVRVGRATADGPARVMLRPEQVRLVSWSEGTPTAEIMSASFEGPITMVTFRAGENVYTLKVPSADAPLQGRSSIVLIGTGASAAVLVAVGSGEVTPFQVLFEICAR